MFLLQSFSKIAKKFFCTFEAQVDPKLDELARRILQSLEFVMRVPKKDVLLEGVKAFQVTMSSQSRFILSYMSIYHGIIAEITSWIERTPETSSLAEYLKKNVTPEIFNLIKNLMAFSDLLNLEADLSEQESNGKKAILQMLRLAKIVAFYPGEHFV